MAEQDVAADDSVAEDLKRMHDEIIASLHEDPSSKQLAQIDERLRILLAVPLARGESEVVRQTRDLLQSVSEEAFRLAGGTRPQWTLRDWGHAWVDLVLLADEVLMTKPDAVPLDILKFVGGDAKRKSYLLAFLNNEGDPVPRRLSEIGALVDRAERDAAESSRVAVGEGDEDAAPTGANHTGPRTNAVFNRLRSLAERRLVKRVGPVQGLYELTRWGCEVARILRNDDLKESTAALQEYGFGEFLALFPRRGASVDGQRIRAQMQQKQDLASASLVADGVLSIALRLRLICRVDSYADEYRLTALGEMAADLVVEMRSVAQSEQKVVLVVVRGGLAEGMRKHPAANDDSPDQAAEKVAQTG